MNTHLIHFEKLKHFWKWFKFGRTRLVTEKVHLHALAPGRVQASAKTTHILKVMSSSGQGCGEGRTAALSEHQRVSSGEMHGHSKNQLVSFLNEQRNKMSGFGWQLFLVTFLLPIYL